MLALGNNFTNLARLNFLGALARTRPRHPVAELEAVSHGAPASSSARPTAPHAHSAAGRASRDRRATTGTVRSTRGGTSAGDLQRRARTSWRTARRTGCIGDQA